MKNSDFKDVKKILIRTANWIGDAIMSTPVNRAVRLNFPDAHISVLAKSWVAPIFYNNPYVDDILLYEDNGRHKGLAGKIRLGNDLRKHNFELTILIQNAFEAAFLTFLARIPHRVGYNTDARGILLSNSIQLDPVLKKGHLIDYYLGIMEGASLRTDDRRLDLFLTEKERGHAEEILSNHGISTDDRLIGINPGAEFGTAKRWLPERFAELSSRLALSCNAKVIIFGTSDHKELGDNISEMSGDLCANLCGDTSLREVLALIEKCSLFITNDSGLMHVASAFDIPQVVIIGSTDYIATGPINPRSSIVRVPTSCSPCLKPDCPDDHRCMKRVTVDMVFNTAETILVESYK